jgi:hypothetical protein
MDKYLNHNKKIKRCVPPVPGAGLGIRDYDPGPGQLPPVLFPYSLKNQLFLGCIITFSHSYK